MPKSMTGFSCFQGQINDWHVLIDIKSVNARFLDIHFRLPEVLYALEPAIEQRLRDHVSRGRIDFRCALTPSTVSARCVIDTTRLAILGDLVRQVNEAFPSAGSLSVADILSWPGVLTHTEAQIDEAFSDTFLCQCARVMAEHQQTCLREGSAIAQVLLNKLSCVEEQTAFLQAQKALLMADYQERIRQRLLLLQKDFPEEQWQQEVIFYAMRADIAEELDRLVMHTAAVREVLSMDGPVGKRLDFLMQELQREANTIASKSGSSAISQAVITLKVCIEEMREQIQNLA